MREKQVVCKKCGTELNGEGDNFGTRIVNGKRYYRHLCRKCHNRYTNGRRGDKQTAGVYVRRMAKLAKERVNSSARIVTNDSKRWDKKHGFEPDPELEKNFVESLLMRGCHYCGATRDVIKLGLDRINNDLGHLKSNVLPACVRCNLVRGGMPHEAWLLVAQGMRQAFEQGFFGEWRPGNRTHYYKSADNKMIRSMGIAGALP